MNLAVPYRWGIRFLIPGLRLDEKMTIDHIELEPALSADGRPQIKGHFRLEYEQCVCQSVVEGDAQERIEDILDAFSLLSTVGHASRPSVMLENINELKQCGLLTPLAVSRTFPIEWNAPAVDADRLQAAVSALSALRKEEKALYHRVLRWIRKLNDDEDAFDRFMSLWIAFNILYGHSRQGSEKGKIEEFVSGSFSRLESQMLLRRKLPYDSIKLLAESRLELKTRGKNRPIADELKRAIESPNTTGNEIEVLVLLALTLYAVRNALFHGELVDKDRSRRELIVKAHGVLASIIYDSLHRRLNLIVPLSPKG